MSKWSSSIYSIHISYQSQFLLIAEQQINPQGQQLIVQIQQGFDLKCLKPGAYVRTREFVTVAHLWESPDWLSNGKAGTIGTTEISLNPISHGLFLNRQ